MAENSLSNGFFSSTDPIFSKCKKTRILEYYNTLFKLFEEETYGFQRLASSICIQLITHLYNIKNGGNNIKNLDSMVSIAKTKMYENINTTIDLKKIASEVGVSYSKFRQDFKKQTGVSPLQYHLLLKIEKSKELLLNTNKSQKEIAFELGFESDYYFNRLFKRKTDIAPGKFKKLNKINT